MPEPQDRPQVVAPQFSVQLDPNHPVQVGQPIDPKPSLTNFLLARIAEDQQAAQYAADENLDATWELDKVHEATRLPRPMAAHIARWDPARVLAECEANRRIIAIHTGALNALNMIKTVDNGSPDAALSIGLVQATIATAEAAIKYLAAVYANHPDYQQDWRPETPQCTCPRDPDDPDDPGDPISTCPIHGWIR